MFRALSIKTKLLLSSIFIPFLFLIGISILSIFLQTIDINSTSVINESAEEISNESELENLAIYIRYYDEVLTESVRNYVLTQEQYWKDRYFENAQYLDRDLEKAIEIGVGQDMGRFEAIEKANTALVNLETKIIELVDEGRVEEAEAIIESEEYLTNKQTYQDNLVEFSADRGLGYNDILRVSTESITDVSSQVDKLFNRGLAISVITLVVIISIILLINMFIYRSIVKPIGELVKAANKLSKGNYSARIKWGKQDEFGRLADTFNMMAVKLEDNEIKHQRESSLARDMIKNIPQAIAMFDKDMHYIMINEQWITQYGLSDKDIIGKYHYDVFPEVPERWKELHQKALAGEVLSAVEDEFPRQDGDIDYVTWAIMPWYTANSNIGGIIMYTEVVTDEKKSRDKIQELNETLKLLNKILRHDILNDITVVDANFESLMKGDDDPTLKEDIETALSRSKKLITKMRDLEQAIVGGDKLEITNLEEVSKEVAGEFSSIEVSVKGKGEARVDEALKSALANLIRNAERHGGASKIGISIKANDKYVVVKVSDNGSGIPDEIKPNLFAEGFSYGDTANTGLGLYIVKRTIERYGGEVDIEDNKPNGATFILKLPKVN